MQAVIFVFNSYQQVKITPIVLIIISRVSILIEYTHNPQCLTRVLNEYYSYSEITRPFHSHCHDHHWRCSANLHSLRGVGLFGLCAPSTPQPMCHSAPARPASMNSNSIRPICSDHVQGMKHLHSMRSSTFHSSRNSHDGHMAWYGVTSNHCAGIATANNRRKEAKVTDHSERVEANICSHFFVWQKGRHSQNQDGPPLIGEGIVS